MTVTVGDHLVDTWRDTQPEAGGIGFFTEPGSVLALPGSP